MDTSERRQELTRRLALAGCVAAEEEAQEILDATSNFERQEAMVERRSVGEPLAWIIGTTRFCGIDVAVEPGVYVPRWQSEPLAILASRYLPTDGVAVDLCTGSGAIAMVLQRQHPQAKVVATESDLLAAACARRNGVTVYEGDLDGGLPETLKGNVDIMVGSLPYVPTDALYLLPRDVQQYEPRTALDGGAGGLAVVRRAIERGPHWLTPQGWLMLEIGGDQVSDAQMLFQASGFRGVEILEDEDGDVRAIFGQLSF